MSADSPWQAVLVATLGAEPQVISLATQLLLRQTEPLVNVVVLHTHEQFMPVAKALPMLQSHFADRPAWPPLNTVLIPTQDVLSPEQLDEFANTLYHTLKQWIAASYRVHLLLAGGRKPMAMLGMSIAQMLLGPDDRVWYLHSDETLRQSGRMLLEADDQAELIAIPLPTLSPTPAHFRHAFQAETPNDARHRLAEEQTRRIAYFLQNELTAAEREVATLVATEVLTVKEIAARLHKSPKTVTNQLNTIYSKLESRFGLAPDVGVKREFLRRVMGQNLP